MKIHVGVFAHNEQNGIASVLADLARQDLFDQPGVSVRVFVLANGCTDNTVSVARASIRAMGPERAECFSVLDLSFKGKSRTWNHFVHELCADGADYVFCVDADIRIPRPDILGIMLERLTTTGAEVVNSRPRKDIEVAPSSLSPLERLIVMASGTSSDYRTAISGSLYLVRTSALRDIYMPIGLPVEDGFLRAMLLTRLLTEAEDLGRIHGEPEIWHVYESLRSVPALLKHQTRLVIGGAINTTVFDQLRASGTGFLARSALLRAAAQDERWLANVVRGTLPRWPSGFVPAHFLVKRLQMLWKHRATGVGRAIVLAGIGFPFDLVVYANAQMQMARGKGAGHW